MKKHDPFESLGFNCSLTGKRFLSSMERKLVGSGMNAAQHIAIEQLLTFGSLTQSQLAENLSITLATMTRLVDRMERDGWVVREIDSKDGRIKHIIPTTKASEIWGQISHIGKEVMDQAYQGISDEDLEIVKRVLKKTRDNLK